MKLWFFLCSILLAYSQRSQIDVYHTSTHDVALARIYNAGLKCPACSSLKIQDAKVRRLRTIVQICRAISSQLRPISTIGRIVKQQPLLHISTQYGELRRINGYDRLPTFGTLANFKGFCVLASLYFHALMFGAEECCPRGPLPGGCRNGM